MLVFTKGKESYIYYACDRSIGELTMLTLNMEAAGYTANSERLFR